SGASSCIATAALPYAYSALEGIPTTASACFAHCSSVRSPECAPLSASSSSAALSESAESSAPVGAFQPAGSGCAGACEPGVTRAALMSNPGMVLVVGVCGGAATRATSTPLPAATPSRLTTTRNRTAPFVSTLRNRRPKGCSTDVAATCSPDTVPWSVSSTGSASVARVSLTDVPPAQFTCTLPTTVCGPTLRGRCPLPSHHPGW